MRERETGGVEGKEGTAAVHSEFQSSFAVGGKNRDRWGERAGRSYDGNGACYRGEEEEERLSFGG